MDGKPHTLPRVAALAAVLAAMLLAIPLANASPRNPRTDQDGWYYTVIRDRPATPAAVGQRSSCQTNRTFAQAARAGVMPAIMAALHGGAPPAVNSLLACATRHH